eukprot:Nk52_evm1s1234 gene=Nk52_evmTU1s1234
MPSADTSAEQVDSLKSEIKRIERLKRPSEQQKHLLALLKSTLEDLEAVSGFSPSRKATGVKSGSKSGTSPINLEDDSVVKLSAGDRRKIFDNYENSIVYEHDVDFSRKTACKKVLDYYKELQEMFRNEDIVTEADKIYFVNRSLLSVSGSEDESL